MKLEVGKSYRTRNGLRATCVADNLRNQQSCAVVIHHKENDCVTTFHSDGFYQPSRTTCCWDLISEWSDKPKVNWSIIPPWFNWVAMNNHGYFFAYTVLPVAAQNQWIYHDPNEDIMAIHPDYAPKWTGDWKQSLVERPKV